MDRNTTADIPVFREEEPGTRQQDIRAIRQLMIIMILLALFIALLLGAVVVAASLILSDLSGIQCAVQVSC